MKRYRLINNAVGWTLFFLSLLTYVLTVEPSVSFWDCPEFVTASARLEICHPPGAPFYMLTGNIFSHLTSDPAKIALMVNLMSGVLSAFTVLFLFWTITHLVRRLIVRDERCVPGGDGPTLTETMTIIASGVAGAMVFAWSDTFWYSAVESEVYAYSSMFTALVVLLMLKWEDHSHEPRSDRWMVLIFYLMGLSIGVHLLNLLCLPALVLIYTYIRYPKMGYSGALIALGISCILIVAVLYGLVPGIVKVGGWFELFFVNRCGLPFNTGMIIYFAVLIVTVLAAIYATTRRNRIVINVLYTASVALLGIPFFGKGPVMPFVIGGILLTLLFGILFVKYEGQYIMRKQALNTSMLCMLMLMIGYSTYTTTVVRSAAEPPMDQNCPEDIFSLSTYLNREQYGESPLLYGRAYTSVAYEYNKVERIRRNVPNFAEKADSIDADRYDIFMATKGLKYAPEMMMLLPRMHSTNVNHKRDYESWLGGVTKHPVTFTVEKDGKKVTKTGEMPSQLDNIAYFFSYQVYQEFLRYFLWNFVGRQNDVSGHGESHHGNFITGFDTLDTFLFGDQDKLPDYLRENKGRNVFYGIPLLLGIIGLLWQLRRRKRGIQHFWVVFFLFFMTGFAIVLYLNQPPSQPRERDYVYVGAFYAFAIWVGYGIAAIAQWPRNIAARFGRQWPSRYDRYTAIVAALIAVAVPLQMVSQTWDDHDRSGRTLARDTGYNFMATFADSKNAILFTSGDNCTFPLWYIQDTEGIGRDVRAINLSYLQTDWYIDQLRSPKWDSPALPIAWHHDEYLDYTGVEVFKVRPDSALLERIRRDEGVDPYELSYIIDNFLRNPSRGYFPTDSLVMTVDKEAVSAAGIGLPQGFKSIPDKMVISFKGKPNVWKSQVMILEVLARNNWERPLYFSFHSGRHEMAGLADYTLQEGVAYRVVPFKVGFGTVDTEKMYENMLHRYRYGGVDRPGVYLDEVNLDMCYTLRKTFLRLAKALVEEGKVDKAREVLQYCKRVLPSANIPYNGYFMGYDSETNVLQIADLWHRVGCDDEAERYLLEMARTKEQFFDYYNSGAQWRMKAFAGHHVLDWKVLDAAYCGLVEIGSPKAAEVKASMDRIRKTPCWQYFRANVTKFEEMKAANAAKAKAEGAKAAQNADNVESRLSAADSTNPKRPASHSASQS